MVNERYLFSIFLDSNSDHEECDVHLVITADDSLRYILRLTSSYDETFTYQDINQFSFQSQLIDMLQFRSMFILRATRNSLKNVSKFRVYVKNISDNNVQAGLENEQALINLIDVNIGKIVVEPFFMDRNRAIPLKRQKENKLVFSTYSKMLAPEQKSGSQEIADRNQSETVFNVRNSLWCRSISKFFFCLNLQNLTFQHSAKESFSWKPKAGFLLYTKGCGRRRTVSSFLNSLAHQEIKIDGDESISNLNCYYSSLVICQESEIEKWRSELNPAKTIVVKERDDFHNITFEILKNGVTIIMSLSALSIYNEISKETINDFASIKSLTDRGTIILDENRMTRLLMNVSERVPHMLAPLNAVNFKTVILDDGFNFDQTDIENISSIKSSWKWICLGSDGFTPDRISPEIVHKFASVLNVPAENIMTDSKKKRFQINPEFWRIIHEYPQLIVKLKTPKSIVRRVALIEVSIPLNTQEKEYVEFLKKFMIHEPFLTLLDSGIRDIVGSETSTVLDRCQPLTIEECLKNCEEHFKVSSGTFGQKMQLKFLNTRAPTTEKSYVLKVLNQEEKCCQVCTEDNFENQVTLCGHIFCSGCFDMLRGTKDIIPCPMCRASLCKYDLFKISKTSTKRDMLSKLNSIKSMLQTIFSKRRNKKRLPPCIWIFCPSEVIVQLTSQFKDENYYDMVSEPTQECSKPKICLMTFEKIDLYHIPENVDGIFLVCPPANQDMYHQIIRKSADRESPVNLYLFVAEDYEFFDEALEIFSKSKCLD